MWFEISTKLYYNVHRFCEKVILAETQRSQAYKYCRKKYMHKKSTCTNNSGKGTCAMPRKRYINTDNEVQKVNRHIKSYASFKVIVGREGSIQNIIKKGESKLNQNAQYKLENIDLE